MSKFSLNKRGHYKLSQENAHEELMELLEHYQIDVDGIDDPKEKSATISTCSRLERYYRLGLVENVRAEGSHAFLVRQHLQEPAGEVDTIDYGRIEGKHKVAADEYETNETYKRTYALMGALSGLGETAIKSLGSTDLSVVECLGLIFLLL